LIIVVVLIAFGQAAGFAAAHQQRTEPPGKGGESESKTPASASGSKAAPSPRPQADYRLRAVRLADGEKLAIDGVLDESVWERAAVANNFTQSEPREGKPATEKTEARIAYDGETLYIGIIAYDSEVRRLLISELKKDFATSDSDVVQVVLDTFHDQRNGYEFATNPGGAKWDAQMTNEGRDVNANWDGVWHVKTHINHDSWIAEIAIPFRTLKFREGADQVWGINFLRRIRRKNEETYWAPIPRIFNSIHYVSRAGVLEGLDGIKPGSNVRIKPYVLGSMTDLSTTPSGLHRVYKGDGGIDAKWGITSGLTLDVTYNTDFSQVEADEQQVNLTRFSLFFPEKRDFFLEGSGIFRFGSLERMGPTISGIAGGGGRQGAVREDTVLFFSRRIGLSDAGEPIPLRGGVRLTGRAGPYELGLLDIQQDASPTTPSTNFLVGRVRRNILANSDVGALLINASERGGGFNRVYGADANFRFYRNLNLSAYLAKTASPSSKDKNVGGRVGLNWRNNFWDTRMSYTNIQPNFNDRVGFVPRVAMHKYSGFFGVHWRPASINRTVREIFPHFQVDYITDPSGRLETRYLDYHLPFTLQNSTFIEIGINPTYERLVKPFNIHPRVAVRPGSYNFNEYFFLMNSDRSKRVSFTTRLATGSFYDGYRQSYSGGVNLRANHRFNSSFTYTRNNIHLSAGDFNTDLFSTRAAYSFSTTVFLNALIQYNSTNRSWASNIRFNIIHRPLSDLYVVYNEQRDSITGQLINRALVVKFTYLLSF
jgi:hypothetical protein